MPKPANERSGEQCAPASPYLAHVVVMGDLGSGPPELIPYWLKHYTAMGVDRIVLLADDSIEARAQKILAQCATRWTFEVLSTRENSQNIAASVGDWLIRPALFELYEFPAPLQRVIAAAERNGVRAIFGLLMDQVAADGTQPRVLPFDFSGQSFAAGPAPSLWRQFPIGCRLTRKFRADLKPSLMLARRDADVESMRPVDANGKARPTPIGRAEQYIIHAFNWYGDAMAARRRELNSPATDELFFWLETHSGRFDLADPALEAVERSDPHDNLASVALLPDKLSYIGDKVALLRCDLAVRESLRMRGLRGDAAVSADGVDLFLKRLMADSREDCRARISPWISRLRTEAAMAGDIATVWMPSMPAAMSDAIREVAGDALVEIKARNLTEAISQIDAARIPLPRSAKLTYAVCTIRNGGPELLPHWLNHYSRMGVDRIVLAVGTPLSPEVKAALAECAAKFQFHRFDVPDESLVGDDNDELHRTAVRHFGATRDSWVLHTDLDEFHEFPAGLQALVAAAEEKEIAAVFGHFVDRVTADGSMPLVTATPDLWEQFPIGCQLTWRIAKGLTQKLMLARYHVRTTTGHHAASNAERGAIPLGKLSDYRVHHFKWHGNVVSRLEWGIARPNVAEIWKKEARALLAWFNANGGKINVLDPQLAAAARRPADAADATAFAERVVAPKRGEVFAVCMLGGSGAAMLGQWVAHYRQMGIERIVLAVAENPDVQTRRVIYELEQSAQFGLLASLPRFVIPSTVKNQRQACLAALRQAGATDNSWVIHADVHQLHEFPVKLSRILEGAESRGIAAIFGQVLDHVAQDGALPADADGEKPVWEQFPLGCRLTEQIGGGVARRLMAARLDAENVDPRERIKDEPEFDSTPLGRPDQYLIHEFSWHLAGIAWRQWAMAQDHHDPAWKGVTAPLLACLEANSGAINIDDPALNLREEWHPSREIYSGAAKSRLPYIGDKVVLLRCERAVFQRLISMGLHTGFKQFPNPWEVNPGAAFSAEPTLTQLRNEAAMRGLFCGVWTQEMPPERVAVISEAAGEACIEITARSVEDAARQIALHSRPTPQTGGKVWAICAIAHGPASVLPYWLEHYSSLGAERMLVAVGDPMDGRTREILAKCAGRWSFDRVDVPAIDCLGPSRHEIHRTLLREAGATPGTWVLHANLDEFHEFPATLSQIIAAAETQKLKAVFGQPLDRVAADGLLRAMLPFDATGSAVPRVSLNEQFPVLCRLSEVIARHPIQKVMLCRFDARAEMAASIASNAGIGCAPIGRPSQYLIHRYKWHADLAARLEWGLGQAGVDQRWNQKAKQLLVWFRLNRGRINTALPMLRAKLATPELRMAS